MAYNPHDLVVCVDKNRCGFLLESCESQIVIKIGDKLSAVHPEGMKTVALLPETGAQRQFKGVVIQLGDIRIILNQHGQGMPCPYGIRRNLLRQRMRCPF